MNILRCPWLRNSEKSWQKFMSIAPKQRWQVNNLWWLVVLTSAPVREKYEGDEDRYVITAPPYHLKLRHNDKVYIDTIYLHRIPFQLPLSLTLINIIDKNLWALFTEGRCSPNCFTFLFKPRQCVNSSVSTSRVNQTLRPMIMNSLLQLLDAWNVETFHVEVNEICYERRGNDAYVFKR